MGRSLLVIGLDVDDKAFHGCGLTRKGEEFRLKTHPSAIKLIKSLEKFYDNGFKPKVAYESGFLFLCLFIRWLKKRSFSISFPFYSLNRSFLAQTKS